MNGILHFTDPDLGNLGTADNAQEDVHVACEAQGLLEEGYLDPLRRTERIRYVDSEVGTAVPGLACSAGLLFAQRNLAASA